MVVLTRSIMTVRICKRPFPKGNAMKTILPTVLCLAMFTMSFAGKERRTVYVFAPTLDEASIGFALSADERSRCEKKIAGSAALCTRAKPVIAACDAASIESAESSHSLICVFLIRHFFLVYLKSGQRGSTVDAEVAVYDSSHGYARPCFTISATSDWPTVWWGNFKPFLGVLEYALHDVRAAWNDAKDSGKSLVSAGVEDLVFRPATADCENSLFLKKPQFTQATVGNEPTEEEIHDFTDEIAHNLEKMSAKRVVVLRAQSDSVTLACKSQVADFSFSKDSGTFTLSIGSANRGDSLSFRASVVESPGTDWTDSVLFFTLIESAFKDLGKAYRGARH